LRILTRKQKPHTKSAAVYDLTVGHPYKVITAFAMPILLSQVFQQLYNTADALVVGRILGTNALAAVSSSGTLIFLLVSFFTGTFMGAGVVISRYFGAGDNRRVSQAVHTNIALGIIGGAVLTVVGVVFTPTFLVWMKTDKDIMPQAIQYFRHYFFGSVPMVMYNVCRGIMTAVGDSKRPLYYLIVSSVLNVVLDVLFLGALGWGVWSAAFATTVSQFVSVVLCLRYLLKKGNIFTVELKKIRLHGEMVKEIIRFGVPSGVQNSVIGIANVVVQTQINSFGRLATAAFGTHDKIEGFAFLPITSFNMALTTFISQNLGARKYDRAKKGARFGIITVMATAQLIGVLFYFFTPQLMALFDNNPQVIALGGKEAQILSLFYFLLAFSYTVAAVCRGAGKAAVPMLVMLSVWCGLRVAYIAFVARYRDILLVFWAYPITWAVSSVIYLIYYRFSDWVHGFESVNRIKE